MGEKVVKTACGICIYNCGMNAYIKNGKIVKVTGMPEHPVNVNQGGLCPKGEASVEILYSPDRLKHPLKRESNTWKRVSWDEALNTIAKKLTEIKETYGARALAIYEGSGVGWLSTGECYMKRFCDVYGSPNYTSNAAMCSYARSMGNAMVYGENTEADYINAKCIMVWGSVLSASRPPATRFILDAKEKGARLIVIDPRATPLAKRADIHARIRPGTDCALALGLLNIIVSEDLYDKRFVKNWTVGFEKLKEHVKGYPPGKVEEITWVAVDTIREIARTYAKFKPACIVVGNAVLLAGNAIHSIRAIASLEAVTGQVDVPGGNVFLPRLSLTDFRVPERVEGKPLGSKDHPLFCKYVGEAHALALMEAILTGKPYPVKAMIVSGSNLALNWPNYYKVKEALKKLYFLVVMDLFMTKTAELADIILPISTFLERTELIDYGPTYMGIHIPERHGYVMLRRKVTKLWECWPEWKIWNELARRMGYEKFFPWHNVEEAIDFMLKPSGITADQLKKRPVGVKYGTKKYRQYKELGFSTASGKIDLYSEMLEKFGYEPLPVHREPPESPISTPNLAKKYPLILSTGARVVEYQHSQHRNILSLRRRVPEPLIEIHPATAGKHGISDGDVIIVETTRGVLKIKAKVTEDIDPRVVQIPKGWKQTNINILTDHEARDPISGYPSLKALLCRLRKA